MSAEATTKSKLTELFEELQVANAEAAAAGQDQLRAAQRVAKAEQRVGYAQRDYQAELSRSRTIDAMRRA